VSRPNIVLLMCDQLRADALGCYGNPFVATPVIDTLAARGSQFESAYTPSPVCVPARQSLITGKEPTTTGCFDNGFPYCLTTPTMMGTLTAGGYRTHGVGKMHFPDPPDNMMGFQTRDIGEEFGGADVDDYRRFLEDVGYGYVTRPHGLREEMYYVPQLSPVPERLHFSHWVADKSIEFLQNRDHDDPYFLWASFIAPHPPFAPPEPWHRIYPPMLMPDPHTPVGGQGLLTIHNEHQNRYKLRDGGSDRRLNQLMASYYFGSISFVDAQIGRILDAIDEAGDRDNTLVVLTADHGEFLGDYGCYGKRSFLDVAARVPLIAAGPGFCQEKRQDVASLIDIAPSILRAAGVAGDAEFDGLALQEVLERDAIFGQFQQGNLALYLACTRDWKYIYSVYDQKEYLLDRVRDPRETRNLAYNPYRRDVLLDMRAIAVGHFDELAACDMDALANNRVDELGRSSDGEFLKSLDVDEDADALIFTRAQRDAPGGYRMR